MSKKSGQIAARIEQFQGRKLDAHYLGYFDCFNRQLFYEAHDVLEELWLANRHGTDGDFYKGLIQLAGAFVHIQKNRRSPAAALFRLARTNLDKYPPRHWQLDVPASLALIEDWSSRLQSTSEVRTLLEDGLAPVPVACGNRVNLADSTGPRHGRAFAPGRAVWWQAADNPPAVSDASPS